MCVCVYVPHVSGVAVCIGKSLAGFWGVNWVGFDAGFTLSSRVGREITNTNTRDIIDHEAQTELG